MRSRVGSWTTKRQEQENSGILLASVVLGSFLGVDRCSLGKREAYGSSVPEDWGEDRKCNCYCHSATCPEPHEMVVWPPSTIRMAHDVLVSSLVMCTLAEC